MEVIILKSGTGAVELTVNGEKKLAVTSNLKSKIYKQISREDLLSEPGLIIKNKKTEPWECTDSLEYDGKLIFPGPYYEGNTLADIDLTIEIIFNLANVFQVFINENIPLEVLYLPGIFILNDGGVLIPPPLLVNYICSQLSENENMNFLQPYNHPDKQGETLFSFILGVLAYKLLTKELPYFGNSITEIREKMRSSKPVEVEYLKPGIKKSLAVLINQSFSLKDINIVDWINQLQLWKEEGAIDPINPEEHLHLQKSATKKQNKRQKQFERKQFFSHNWKTITVITAVLASIISFSIGPIKNAMEPPITTGMTAEEVVETYYRGILDMDVEIMEDCIIKAAGKNDINEVTQLYVISKVRTGYEGKSGLISAQDWNDGVITTLEPGEQVYGIANLTLDKIDNSSFQANYIRWYPNIPEDAESEKILPPIKIYVKDILTLEKVKEVWVINNLTRETME